jgi:hypothetical protein
MKIQCTYQGSNLFKKARIKKANDNNDQRSDDRQEHDTDGTRQPDEFGIEVSEQPGKNYDNSNKCVQLQMLFFAAIYQFKPQLV